MSSQKKDSGKSYKMNGMLEKVPLVVAFWLATHSAHALDVNVSRFDDPATPTVGTLRNAVSQVNADFSFTDDSINLSAGTYSLTYGGSGENFNTSGDLDIFHAGYGTLTIQGVGAGSTIVDASTLSDRAFHVQGVNVVFKNLTIRGGRVTQNGTNSAGGAILGYGGNVTLDGVILENNSALGSSGPNGADGLNQTYGGPGGFGSPGYAGTGGGIYFDSGLTSSTLTITNSIIRNNTARGGDSGRGGNGGSGNGGGAGGQGGTSGSAAGGGIYIANGTVTITNSTISGNSATAGTAGAGGAGGAQVNLDTLGYGGAGGRGGAGNTAVGGGIFNNGTLTITNSTFSGNSVTGSSGGAGGAGGARINGTAAGNGGQGGNGYFGGGGGIYTDFRPADVRNSTIASNSAIGGAGGAGGAAGANGGTAGTAGFSQPGAGGGFHTFGSVTIPRIGSAAALPGAPTLTSTIVGDNTAQTGADVFGDVVATNSLLETTAGANLLTGSTSNVTGQDAGLQALGNNGGPTPTHALSVGSPAINTGSNPQSLTTDQRGTGYARTVGSGTDIGAFEFNAPPTISVTFTPAAPTTSDTVVFNAVAVDPEGGPVTLSYNYGDGSAADALGSHKYAANGTYTVTVTATDAQGNAASATVSVTVGGTTDNDNDNFSNVIEENLLTDENSTNSRPFNLPIPSVSTGLKIASLQVTLHFKKTNRDSLTLAGQFPSPTSALGKYVIVEVGGIVKAFALDQFGRSPLFDKDFTFKITDIKDGQGSKFTMKLNKGAFAALLADEGLTAGSPGNKTVRANVIFDNKSYFVDIPVKWNGGRVTGKTLRTR